MASHRHPLTARSIELDFAAAGAGFQMTGEGLRAVFSDPYVQKKFAKIWISQIFSTRRIPGAHSALDVFLMERGGREYHIQVCRFASPAERLRLPRFFNRVNSLGQRGERTQTAIDFYFVCDFSSLERIVIYPIPATVLRGSMTLSRQLGASLSARRFGELLHEGFDITVAKCHVSRHRPSEREGQSPSRVGSILRTD